MTTLSLRPDLSTLKRLLSECEVQPNVAPLCAVLPGAFHTPSAAYLKVSQNATYSFLLESIIGGEQIGRYSWVGANPYRVIKSGDHWEVKGDPLIELEKVLSEYRTLEIPNLPPMPGGAIGYVSYDCIKYFEPKTERPLKDILQIPEGVFMFFDPVIVFDHLFQTINVISHVQIPPNNDDSALDLAYQVARDKIQTICNELNSPGVPLPPQGPITLNNTYTSNVGQTGYEAYVQTLKEKIIEGQIIQAVPSQRLARPTSLHPFNIYRHLRTVNPSPYMFYIDCGDFQLVGASPELLVKSENGRIITHPIAGTIRRGQSADEDECLADALRHSVKDRAEHVMLVDLARNDINRVCDPTTTSVDRFLTIEKFSHVQHLVSQVSGVLRKDKTRFDAFRSVFPAGTVSGAPKVRAMELIGQLEGETRGIYGGSVGRWGFERDSLDTCLVLRTMTFKDGVAYLQAGGGIVYDSNPHDEYVETLNKMKSNMTTIEEAEEIHCRIKESQVM